MKQFSGSNKRTDSTLCIYYPLEQHQDVQNLGLLACLSPKIAHQHFQPIRRLIKKREKDS